MHKILLLCFGLLVPHSIRTMESERDKAIAIPQMESKNKKPTRLAVSAPQEWDKQPHKHSSRSLSPQSRDSYLKTRDFPEQQEQKKHTREQSPSRSLSPQPRPDFYLKTSDPKDNQSTEKRSRPEGKRIRFRNSKKRPSFSPLSIKTNDTSSDSKNSTSDSSISPRKDSPRKDSPRKTPKILFDAPQTPGPDFTNLVNAIRKGKPDDVIKSYLDRLESNPNWLDDSTKNTPLQLATIKHNTSGATLIICDARINSLTKSANQRTPYQCIIGNDTDKYSKLHQALQSRARLDYIVDALLMTDSEIIDTKCTDRDAIIKIINALLTKIPQGIIPHYADAESIFAMIFARLEYDLPFLKIARDAYKTKPNYKDEWGTTSADRALYLHNYDFLDNPENNPNKLCTETGASFLHRMVDKCNEPITTLVLSNPYIDSLTKNAKNLAAYQCMTKDNICNYPTLYKALQQRAMLDRIIKALMVTDKKIVETKCKEKTINKRIKTLLARISQEIIPHYTDMAFVHKMIHAHRLYNLESLKKLYDNYMKELNYQDPESGYTLTHQLVLLRDENRLKQLLENPAVQILKDKENQSPQALLYSLENNSAVRIIRTMLFARDCLEKWIPEAIAQSVEGLLWTKPTMDLSKIKVSDIDIEDVIEKIKLYEEKIKNKQGDSDLPSEVDMPNDANDTFISKAIKARMNEEFISNAIKAERKSINPMQHFSLPIEYLDNTPSLSSPRKQLPTPEELVIQTIENISIPQLRNSVSEEDQASLLEFLGHKFSVENDV